MTRRRLTLLALLGLVALVAGVSLGQPPFPRGGRGSRGGRGGWNGGMPTRTIPEDRKGVPNWKVDEHFKSDVFTFVRIEYDSYGGGRGGRGGWGYGWQRWLTDFPDSDLNFSFRLQQLTSLKVNPEPITRRLTDKDLCDYPFIYIIEPGALSFSPEEGAALRHYLLNGGFLMVDDFWGDFELENFLEQMRMHVFPEEKYVPKELPLEHPIFQCVYRLKERPQVPSIHSWAGSGETWEWGHGGNTHDVHYRGISDDKDRLMAIICHNTDLGDGWEREGENEEYFHEFSEKKSYPLGINIVTYAMTH
jgi:hypothetical protein